MSLFSLLFVTYLLLIIINVYVKCQECNGCVTVGHFRCLEPCSEVQSLYLNKSGYNNWDGLAEFSNLTIFQLFMNDNILTSLTKKAPKCLENVKSVYLKNNYIEVITSETFSGMKKLIKLNLATNKISDIDPYAFKSETLKNLVLDENNITKIDFVLPIRSLQILSLSNNQIENLDVFYSNRFENLIELNLDWNYIKYIKDNFFENLPRLNDIDLSQNRILTIESTVNVRRSINLSSNQLNCFNYTNFAEIDLNGNYLFCEFLEEIRKNDGVNCQQKGCKNNPNQYCLVNTTHVSDSFPLLLINNYLVIIIIVVGLIPIVIIFVCCWKFYTNKKNKRTERPSGITIFNDVELRQLHNANMSRYSQRWNRGQSSKRSTYDVPTYDVPTYDRVRPLYPQRTLRTTFHEDDPSEHIYEPLGPPRCNNRLSDDS